MSQRRRAYVETYGCQMNISDGELMQGILEAQGYEIAERPEDADVILVNTCAVREHAERRVLGRVSQLNGLKADNPDLVLGVTGCMAQRMGADLARKAPWVDLVMGPDGYRSLPEALERIQRGDGAAARVPERSAGARVRNRGLQLTVVDFDTGENYEGLEQRRTSEVAAWVPIQRGCNHRCTYCIVPYVRGSEKNRESSDILDEIAGIAEGGVSEITLLGQTVNSWTAGGWSFARLLSEVARVPGIRRVRFTSPHPRDVTEDLVQVMADEPAVCEQLHLPAQAGNNRTLKRMVRRYTVEEFLDKVELARRTIPDVALSTDIIVAFPGETEAEFQDTLALMRAVRFDDAFTYKFSAREGTPATRLPADDAIPPAVAQARLEQLIEVARGIQAEINESEVGRIEEVLIEKPARDPGQLLGRTRRNKVVAFPGELSAIGSYRRVRLTSTTGATFVGEAIDAEAPGEAVPAGAALFGAHGH